MKASFMTNEVLGSQAVEIVAMVLSFWALGLLLYQGSVLFWNGRRNSPPALLAGLSLILAAVFFILHILGLSSFQDGNSEKILALLPAALYLAVLLSFLFLINVLVSERKRRGQAVSLTRSGMFSVLLCSISLMVFFLVEVWIPEQGVLVSLLQRRLNPGLLLLGTSAAIPAISATLVLNGQSGSTDRSGRVLLKRGAYSLMLLVFIAVLAWFLGRENAAIALGLDVLAQLSILWAIIWVSQASVRYEVFSGSMPRLGMLRYFRKNVAFLLCISLVAGFLYQWLDEIYWAIILVSSLGTQAGYLEYRMMKDREKILTRMQSSVTANLYGQLFRNESDAAEEVLGNLCREFDLNSGKITPAGTHASILGKGLEVQREPAGKDSPWQHTIIPLGPDGKHGSLHLKGPGLTREEAAFTRSIGERLLDAMALIQFSRTLMDLQKDYLHSRKLTETMSRRVLHDEVLPEIHSLILEESVDRATTERLTNLHKSIAGLLKEMPGYDNTLLKKGLLGGIREIMGRPGYATGELAVTVEPDLNPSEKETVFYALREILHNAASHSDTPVIVSSRVSNNRLDWQIGPAPAMERDSHAFEKQGALPELETNTIKDPDISGSGSGQGLAIHSTLLLLCDGGLEVLEWPGFSVRVFIR